MKHESMQGCGLGVHKGHLGNSTLITRLRGTRGGASQQRDGPAHVTTVTCPRCQHPASRSSSATGDCRLLLIWPTEGRTFNFRDQVSKTQRIPRPVPLPIVLPCSQPTANLPASPLTPPGKDTSLRRPKLFKFIFETRRVLKRRRNDYVFNE